MTFRLSNKISLLLGLYNYRNHTNASGSIRIEIKTIGMWKMLIPKPISVKDPMEFIRNFDLNGFINSTINYMWPRQTNINSLQISDYHYSIRGWQ